MSETESDRQLLEEIRLNTRALHDIRNGMVAIIVILIALGAKVLF